MAWQHGGLFAMSGQANHFVRFAKEKVPYAMQRFVGETERLYGVLDARLAERDYIVGPGRGRYTIADIAMLGWVDVSPMTTISLAQFPAVHAWLRRCRERPAVQRGLAVPSPARVSALKAQEGDAAAKTQELKKLVDQAKEQYGYKYTSP